MAKPRARVLACGPSGSQPPVCAVLVPADYIGTNGYYYRDDLAGLNLATNPATFLELGNMGSDGDVALQSSQAGRASIARAVGAGILAFLHRR